MTRPTISIFQTTDELSCSLGLYLERLSANKAKFTLALSGGSLPSLLGSHLPSSLTGQGWSIFYADERCVPHTSPDSNHSLVTSHILSKLPLASVYPISESLVQHPDLAAKAYERDMRRVFGESVEVAQFDLILLGMGPDGLPFLSCMYDVTSQTQNAPRLKGHTCSLFPSHALLDLPSPSPWIASLTDSPKPPPSRITLTLSVLNAAKEIGFVVTGESKAGVVKEILNGLFDGESVYPAGLGIFHIVNWMECIYSPHESKKVQPTSGHVTWFLDVPAASKL